MQGRHGGHSRRPDGGGTAPNPDKSPPTDTGADATATDEPAPAPAPKKRKPKPQPAVVAAPDAVTVEPVDPPPAQSTPGNARVR